MKAKSHRTLGEFLAEAYLTDTPRRYIRVFLLGCTQPDKNPTTYLKGSIRGQWLRGHNWGNAQRYMQRLASRLEHRKSLKLLDYYSLGKLIHYTADAFTSAHNAHFPGNIQAHRRYEAQLQAHFLRSIPDHAPTCGESVGDLMDIIRTFHRQYSAKPISILDDCRYSLLATSAVLRILSPKTA